MKEIVLDGQSLTLEELTEIAQGEAQVACDPMCCKHVQESREIMIGLMGKQAIYGLNRGVGWNKDVVNTAQMLKAYNVRLLNSHAVGLPPYHTVMEARAILAIRLNTALSGASCITDRCLSMYQDFLNHGITPLIPRRGSVGEGDITTLSHIGQAFMGKGLVYYRGKQMDSLAAMQTEGITPLSPDWKDGHSIIVSNAQGEAMTAILLLETEKLMAVANLIYCLDYEGLNGVVESLDASVNEIRKNTNQSKSAAQCRRFLQGSYLLEPDATRPLQDPLSFRGGFAIHGTVLDAVDFLKKHLLPQINSPADNPCILREEKRVCVTSNFETTTLAIGVEMLKSALAHASKATCYRMLKMGDPTFTRLTRYLAPPQTQVMGYAILQDTFMSLYAENRHLCNPATMDFDQLEGTIEDHASNLPYVTDTALKMLDNLRYLLAMEAMFAAQAVDLRGNVQLGAFTQKAYAAIRAEIPFLLEDRLIHRDICKAYDLICSDKLFQITRG